MFCLMNAVQLYAEIELQFNYEAEFHLLAAFCGTRSYDRDMHCILLLVCKANDRNMPCRAAARPGARAAAHHCPVAWNHCQCRSARLGA